MTSRSAKIRAAVTAVGVVLGVALLLGITILLLGSIVGYIGGTLFAGGGGDGSAVSGPDVQFETAFENESVEIRHVGNESANTTEITFEINGDDRGTWADHSGSGPTQIEAGDSVTIAGVATGDELVVRWERAETSRVLYRETLEE